MRIAFTSILALLVITAIAQIPSDYYKDLNYRMIGPFRAGRTVGAVGVPTQPNVFYIGVNNGGVWKTNDYGRTWVPLFDAESTGSIGDIAVSASNPNIIYVGTGEGLHRPDLSTGDGVFKSTDAGQTWKNVGLIDVQQIGRIVVHPTNPDIVFVAALGHPYEANEMRGVYRSTNGGATWEKTFYINHNTGCIQVEIDPSNPQVVYADMWEHQEGPWENAAFSGPSSGLYKSVDGGSTWKKLMVGLPGVAEGLGRIGLGISPSDGRRLYATVDARSKGGIYGSKDGGETWSLLSTDRRLWGRGGDFGEIRVHPKNPEVIYVGNIAAYRSDDGGKSWTSFKGAPGGDDYHRIWINPLNPDIILLAADQGAVVSVNGGATWSSWYNQPTAQLYHVTTDNQFPYYVYGGQQESGAIGVASRGNGGQISFRDWHGVGADEYAYVAPDPLNPDIIYGGRVTKFNRKTGQTQSVSPEAIRSGEFRYLRTLPLMFHPANAQMLLFATNKLWKTMNGGQSWETISPDLTREHPEVPSSVGDFKTTEMETMPRRAVIYAVTGSPLDENILWVGTDDGLVHRTTDGGKTWNDVTPAGISSWDKIAQIDAGHFDEQTCYIAVNSFRKNDLNPHIYRTHDGGATWKEIVNGINETGAVNTVKEDPKQQGLLFAGTERAVYFSRDDGDHWQSLRQNMPASSIRDLVVHDDDLVVGTHGRSIWILDGINPLRQLAQLQTNKPVLYKPGQATRVRFNMFSDTPLPPEEPAGENPPDGSLIDYYLPGDARNVKLEIADAQGKIIRTFTNNDSPRVIDSTRMPHATYWTRPAQILSGAAGHHRFVWDLRFPEPPGSGSSYPIAAVYKATGPIPVGPYVHPGTYTLKLVVDGMTLETSVDVRLDPRVTASPADIGFQTDLSMRCYNSYLKLQEIRGVIDAKLSNGSQKWKKGQKAKYEGLRGDGLPDGGDFHYGSIRMSPPGSETIVSLQDKLLYMLNVLQSADARPTDQATGAVEYLEAQVGPVEKRWKSVQ